MNIPLTFTSPQNNPAAAFDHLPYNIIIDKTTATIINHDNLLLKRLDDFSINNSVVFSPWGWYQTLVIAKTYHVKQIRIDQGQRLSLQKHVYRSEYWIIIKGTALVTCGSATTKLTAGNSTFITAGQVHRIANHITNPDNAELIVLEIQIGKYFGEDDIIRLADDYGRI